MRENSLIHRRVCMPFHVVENVLGIFELLIATFQIAIDGVLLAVMHARLFQRAETMRTVIAGHVEIFVNLLVVFVGDLRRSNSEGEIVARATASGPWQSGGERF